MLSFGKNTEVSGVYPMDLRNVLWLPFAAVYRLATGVRNHLYDINHKKSFSFDVPVVGVGNLNLGGSGKTPAIEYLVKLLYKDYHVVTLSRGYGRQTRGLRFADMQDNAATIGDEPFQVYRNFGKWIKVVVGEDRAFAIPHILHQYPATSVILLDDAFQHRSVQPQLNILLTDFERPFYKDFLVPLGRLREARKEASRAHLIVVTKCPEAINDEVQKEVTGAIGRYAGDIPVFFSTIRYKPPVPFKRTNGLIHNQVVLLSGIAKPRVFEQYAASKFNVIKHFVYPDHHVFKPAQLKHLRDFILKQKEETALLTTEKDMARLLDSKYGHLLADLPCFFLPIEMAFCKNGSEFDNIVRAALKKGSNVGAKEVE